MGQVGSLRSQSIQLSAGARRGRARTLDVLGKPARRGACKNGRWQLAAPIPAWTPCPAAQRHRAGVGKGLHGCGQPRLAEDTRPPILSAGSPSGKGTGLITPHTLVRLQRPLKFRRFPLGGKGTARLYSDRAGATRGECRPSAMTGNLYFSRVAKQQGIGLIPLHREFNSRPCSWSGSASLGAGITTPGSQFLHLAAGQKGART